MVMPLLKRDACDTNATVCVSFVASSVMRPTESVPDSVSPLTVSGPVSELPTVSPTAVVNEAISASLMCMLLAVDPRPIV